MLSAPSLEDVRVSLITKQSPIIGILFVPPYTKMASESIVPRLEYLNARSAEHIHFFCAGYGGYEFAADAQPIGVGKYEDEDVIPWGFSQPKFANFVTEIEDFTSWKYSGEADLILINPDLEFMEAVVFDMQAMLKDGAIDNPAQLFEAIIAYAKSRGKRASTYTLSDREGVRTFGKVIAESIIERLPKPLQNVWKRGIHYRVQNLSRA